MKKLLRTEQFQTGFYNFHNNNLNFQHNSYLTECRKTMFSEIGLTVFKQVVKAKRQLCFKVLSKSIKHVYVYNNICPVV